MGTYKTARAPVRDGDVVPHPRLLVGPRLTSRPAPLLRLISRATSHRDDDDDDNDIIIVIVIITIITITTTTYHGPTSICLPDLDWSFFTSTHPSTVPISG